MVFHRYASRLYDANFVLMCNFSHIDHTCKDSYQYVSCESKPDCRLKNNRTNINHLLAIQLSIEIELSNNSFIFCFLLKYLNT